MVSSDESIVALLERIAVALETIAGNPKAPAVKAEETQFPWWEMSRRCRDRLRDEAEKACVTKFGGRKWPFSCEDLFALGFEYMTKNAAIRQWGKVSGLEVAAKLDELGFKDWSST